MNTSATVAVRFVEMTTDEQVMAWRASLRLLLELTERIQKNSEREGDLETADITLADTRTEGGENWTNTAYAEIENLCVFEPNH